MNRTINVADSIQLTAISNAEHGFPIGIAPLVSPDNKRVALVLRRASLETGFNTYSLVVLNTDAALRYANGASDTRPSMTTLATFPISVDRPGIERVEWLPDSGHIAFVGRRSDHPGEVGDGQVYLVDVSNSQLEQLTHHPEDVASFSLDQRSARLIFQARVTPDWSESNLHGYAITSEHIGYLLQRRDPRTTLRALRYYSTDQTSRPVVESDADAGAFISKITPSHDGSRALVLMRPKSVPDLWERYAFIRDQIDRSRATFGPNLRQTLEAQSAFQNDDTFGRRLEWLVQYGVFDIESGQLRAVVDAPADSSGMALWLPGDRRVILAGSYLPAEGSRSHTQLEAPAIIEVDVVTGRAVKVCDLQPDGLVGFRRANLVKLEFVQNELRLHWEDRDGTQAMTAYQRRGGSWTFRYARRQAPPAAQFFISESLNSPPELAVRDTTTGQERVVTDLNPQLRSMALGRAEVFEWADETQKRYQGGLLYPPGFREGVKYPLVVQAYGFSPTRFLLDGQPGQLTGGFAARALAARGMLVLQLGNEVGSSATENQDFLRMLESALDALDDRGLINDERVGLTGFSRSGMWVLQAITFSSRTFAAANISDGNALTPFNYSMYHGFPYPGMMELETITGAPLWGDGVQAWIEQSPAFHLDRVRAALRLENFGLTVPTHWDTFTQLQRHQRPVELFHVPIADHLLMAPYSRFASQQSVVDWFSFWLLDQVRTEPMLGTPETVNSLTAQYDRWRRLRQRRDALAADRQLLRRTN